MAAENINIIQDFQGETPAQQALFGLLKWAGIATQTYAHPPIFTVEEGLALNLPAHIPGQHGKSLFLTTPKGDFWLVVAIESTRVNLKELAARAGVKRFSFAKPEQMVQILGVTPGSATPFALMSDEKRIVTVVIDEAFTRSTHAVFHPLDNRYSTVIAVPDLIKFIQGLGYAPQLCAVA